MVWFRADSELPVNVLEWITSMYISGGPGVVELHATLPLCHCLTAHTVSPYTSDGAGTAGGNAASSSFILMEIPL